MHGTFGEGMVMGGQKERKSSERGRDIHFCLPRRRSES